ncbi:hypothetical protein DBV05_g4924 [Lasiodiplodia theobromae]|uniref:Uncharacterized protein n=1 Tax=Lasiodiplodia theobromae TaxID=45133 RepID=A0A5N5DFL7_9PEZI|nr:hypothetical protein DBV05_g4924 [Lasiodiplodia theobromae]
MPDLPPSPLSTEPPSLTSDKTISTSPTAQPRTPTDGTPKAAQQRRHQRSTANSPSSPITTFNPASSADRQLARAAGMRIDTPTSYPRLLLEPHITLELDRARFANDAAEVDRAASALLAHHGNKLLLRTTDSNAGDEKELEWAARRRQARAHRAANPISVASTSGAFTASISPQDHNTAVVQLPASFLDTANRVLSAELAEAWLWNEQSADYNQRQPLPLFVYGNWMFPVQMAAAVLFGGGDGGASAEQPTAADIKEWTERMVPAVLGNEGAEGGAWHRYCVRGRAPTAALLEKGNPRLKYYIRDVGEQGPIEGRLVLGVSAEQWDVLDAFLEVGANTSGGERIWGKKVVQVGVRVKHERNLVPLRAVTYVWKGDPMDLHIFKVDKVWTPELYVEWHCRTRREMAAAAKAAKIGG